MPRLMKLAISADVDVEVQPDVQRFFWDVDEQYEGPTTITIGVADFEDDDGNAATELPGLATDNSYYEVYINGVLQMEALSVYTPTEAEEDGELTIELDEGEIVLEDTPVVLKVVNFDPTADGEIQT